MEPVERQHSVRVWVTGALKNTLSETSNQDQLIGHSQICILSMEVYRTPHLHGACGSVLPPQVMPVFWESLKGMMNNEGSYKKLMIKK